MPEGKYFLITQEEITGLITEKDIVKRTNLMITITQRTYKERTALESIGAGLGKVFESLDRMTDPPQKKRGRGP
jgi:hypothetical protein